MACKCENDKIQQAAQLTLNSIIEFWVACDGDKEAMKAFFLKMQETITPTEPEC
jgi:hypothetical protein